MSEATSTPSSSSFESNLKTIFEKSLEDYKKKTKVDLLEQPLMDKLQTCNSPTETLALLRAQVEKSEESSTSGDIKSTKWLKPIVHVLSAFSFTIGAGLGLVNPIRMIFLRSILSYHVFRNSNLRISFSLVLESSFW
jgi:hypothetical protein